MMGDGPFVKDIYLSYRGLKGNHLLSYPAQDSPYHN